MQIQRNKREEGGREGTVGGIILSPAINCPDPSAHYEGPLVQWSAVSLNQLTHVVADDRQLPVGGIWSG